jgi:hypothetical protein
VEGHFVGLHAVDFALGPGDTLEDGDGVLFYEIAEPALPDEVADFGEAAAVVVIFVIVMLVFMVMFIMGVVLMLFVIVMMMAAVFVFLLMGMGMVVVFLVAVLMFMFILMGLILGVGVGCSLVDGKSHALDALAGFPFPMGVKIADLQLAEFPFEGGGFDAQVAKGADGHIATNAGETVEV